MTSVEATLDAFSLDVPASWFKSVDSFVLALHRVLTRALEPHPDAKNSNSNAKTRIVEQ